MPLTFARCSATRLGAALSLLATTAVSAPAQGSPCDAAAIGETRPSSDLYCVQLLPSGAAEAASGTAALEWEPGPFTISTTRDGTPRWRVAFDLHGMPVPAGPRAGLVAWAAPPTMSPLIRLGSVRNGRSVVGPVALDRFILLISAEPDSSASERRGPVLLRGQSASSRLRPPELFQFALGVLGGAGGEASHAHHHVGADSMGWTTVPMLPGFAMLPSEMALRPAAAAWLPPEGTPAPLARTRQVLRLAAGDTLDLEAAPVRRTIAGRSYTMLGFNGQIPGPLLRVEQGTEIVVRFHNQLPLPSTVHWHGLRLDARFDGVPELSQAPVAPGDSFTYHLRFPDAGLYWYHPHVREDIQQDLGLYGNIFVPPPATAGWSAAREEFLLLDDLLVGDDGLVPYGRDTPTHAAMGRFGNLFLVNGESDWRLTVKQGELLRLFLTNAANARVFNLSLLPEAPLRLRAADLGRYPRPIPIDHLVLGPAERYVVDVRFERPGRYALVNRVHALDHLYGRFVPLTDTLGIIDVAPARAPVKAAPAPVDTAAANEVSAILARSGAAESRVLELGVRFSGLPFLSERLMKLDSIFFAPVEWAGTMATMNWATTGTQAHWALRDPVTGHENHEIGWRFPRGTLLRLTLVNRRDVLHAMQHPMHLHGQRFLVLAVGGVANPHPAWKDTVIVPAGGTVELLVDLTNPGPWMLHCHIAEHLGAGMMTTIVVEE